MCGCGDSMFRMGGHGAHGGHQAHSEYDAIKHELKTMYARGEIDDHTYHRLKHLAKEGEIDWVYVRRLQTEGRNALVAKEGPTKLPFTEHGTVAPQASAESISPTEWIRQRTEQLRAAEEESRALLSEVEAKAAELRARLDESQGDAGSTNGTLLPSEAERKLAVQQQISILETRASELREDLQRIDSLRSQLVLREQENKVAESRRRIAALEEEIRGE